jgi:hypothetical protein
MPFYDAKTEFSFLLGRCPIDKIGEFITVDVPMDSRATGLCHHLIEPLMKQISEMSFPLCLEHAVVLPPLKNGSGMKHRHEPTRFRLPENRRNDTSALLGMYLKQVIFGFGGIFPAGMSAPGIQPVPAEPGNPLTIPVGKQRAMGSIARFPFLCVLVRAPGAVSDNRLRPLLGRMPAAVESAKPEAVKQAFLHAAFLYLGPIKTGAHQAVVSNRSSAIQVPGLGTLIRQDLASHLNPSIS